jgi:hypothetical protein
MSLASAYAIIDGCNAATTIAPRTLEQVRAGMLATSIWRKNRIEHARRATAAGKHDLARAYRRQAAAADLDLEDLDRAERDLENP